MRYQILHNIDALFMRPYRPGDRLIEGHVGELDGDHTPEVAAELVFARHNRDDRPDGRDAPSLSIGDVVVLDGDAWSVASLGFEAVTVTGSDVHPGPYRARIDLLGGRSTPRGDGS